MRAFIFAALCISVPCDPSNMASAQFVTIDINTTVDATNFQPPKENRPYQRIRIAPGNNPPTVVDIVDGGRLQTVDVTGGSIANLRGGVVIGVNTFDGLGGINVDDISTLNLSEGGAGSTGPAVTVFGRLNMTGGVIGGGDTCGSAGGRLGCGALALNGNATGEISGGEVTSDMSIAVLVTGNAELTVSGGQISNFLGNGIVTQGNSHVSISGGVIGFGEGTTLHSEGTSTIDIHGGEFHEILELHDASSMNIFGGEFGIDGLGDIIAFDSTVVNIFGGNFLNNSNGDGFRLSSSPTASVNLFGTDWNLESVDRDRFITGTLADGTPANFRLGRSSSDIFLHTVPEPSTLLLAAFGVAILVFRRVVRRRALCH